MKYIVSYSFCWKGGPGTNSKGEVMAFWGFYIVPTSYLLDLYSSLDILESLLNAIIIDLFSTDLFYQIG